MGNKIYKAEISAPATANKVKSLEFVPDKQKGKGFRIEKLWIAFPSRDAAATGDKIGFQISTQSQNENAALLEIDSEYEVFTKSLIENVLGTNGSHQTFDNPEECIPIPSIEGTMLKSGKKYYFNSIVTGQDAADIVTKLKFLAQYVNPKDDLEDWHDNALS